jgi:hypothetical protein
MRWKLPTLAALAAVVLLAGGGALAGLLAGGAAGVVIGGVGGGLAGVAAGYVPVFQDRARQRAETCDEQTHFSQANRIREVRQLAGPGQGQS